MGKFMTVEQAWIQRLTSSGNRQLMDKFLTLMPFADLFLDVVVAPCEDRGGAPKMTIRLARHCESDAYLIHFIEDDVSFGWEPDDRDSGPYYSWQIETTLPKVWDYLRQLPRPYTSFRLHPQPEVV